jgi:hypothetical protein
MDLLFCYAELYGCTRFEAICILPDLTLSAEYTQHAAFDRNHLGYLYRFLRDIL